jgi:hypothetical protein
MPVVSAAHKGNFMLRIAVLSGKAEMLTRTEGASQGQRIESEIISPRDRDTVQVKRYAELAGIELQEVSDKKLIR